MKVSFYQTVFFLYSLFPVRCTEGGFFQKRKKEGMLSGERFKNIFCDAQIQMKRPMWWNW
ncbi:MAG: hypothetical protein HYV45_03200 [Candidatus Moranbacteria bacterium]|nr:hypothetical protein [Candidatus Moranbacteria bacterium]